MSEYSAPGTYPSRERCAFLRASHERDGSDVDPLDERDWLISWKPRHTDTKQWVAIVDEVRLESLANEWEKVSCM